MKKVGLFLSVEPEKGGTYQYTLSVIKALESLPANEYKVVCFYLNSDWQSLLPVSFEKIYYHRPFWRKLVSKAYKTIDTSSKGLSRYGAFFNPVIHLINKSDCELVIFPNQDPVTYQISKRSLTSVHDLMHRYEPQFKEYQGGVYQLREHHYKNICKHTAGVLVDSNLGKQHVVESYRKPLNEVFVLPFVPPFYLLQENVSVDVQKKFGLNSDFIFYPAQFWEHKNHINLIRAFVILKEKFPSLQLALSGAPKDNYKAVIDEIKKLKLENSVKLLGYVENSDMVALYRTAVCMAFVSLLGPTNIPPLEAMLLKCPLVVSNKYAMPEQVEDGALLVDPLKPEDIANKIARIYLDKDLRKDLVEKAFKKVSAYSQEQFNKNMSDILEVLMNK
jgi:glycosyltransferase involved in cell wall biosynthesis